MIVDKGMATKIAMVTMAAFCFINGYDLYVGSQNQQVLWAIVQTLTLTGAAAAIFLLWKTDDQKPRKS